MSQLDQTRIASLLEPYGTISSQTLEILKDLAKLHDHVKWLYMGTMLLFLSNILIGTAFILHIIKG